MSNDERTTSHESFSPDVSDEVLTEIGRFVLAFSALELHFRATLGDVLALGDDFDAATAGYDFAMLVSVVHSVFSRRYQHVAAEIEEIVSQARAINDERVRVVHGTWLGGRGGGVLRHVSRRSLRPTFYYEGGPSELRAWSKKAEALQWRWNVLFFGVRYNIIPGDGE